MGRTRGRGKRAHNDGEAAAPANSTTGTEAAASAAGAEAPSSPAPAAYEGPRPSLMANCIINGIANFKVVMLDTDDLASTPEIAVTEALITKPRHAFNGRVELRFLFVSPTLTEGVPGFRQAHRGGRVIIDGTIAHELGPLQRHRAVQSAVLLDAAPTTVRIEVFTSSTPLVHPAEALLADHVLAILELDEFAGSVSSSHLQNQVRELPFYPLVFEGGIRGSWAEFIAVHPDKWGTFKYTPEEIERNDIGTTCRTKELRVYALKNAASFRVGDIARERVRVKAEEELQDVLTERLRERPYEQSELLKELVTERSFLTLITPNLSKILAMFEEHPDDYFVLNDPLHPIAVEPRRACLDAPGPRNGLQYDRVRRQMIPKTEVPLHRGTAAGSRVTTTAPSAAASEFDREDDAPRHGDDVVCGGDDGAAIAIPRSSSASDRSSARP